MIAATSTEPGLVAIAVSSAICGVLYALLFAALRWGHRAERAERAAQADLAERCEQCPRRHEGYPGWDGGHLCAGCWSASFTDDPTFAAAVEAGMFEIPLEELSRLVDGDGGVER